MKVYQKPTLIDMNDYEMRKTNGGGVPVVPVAAVAVIMIMGGFVLTVAATMAGAAVFSTVVVGP